MAPTLKCGPTGVDRTQGPSHVASGLSTCRPRRAAAAQSAESALTSPTTGAVRTGFCAGAGEDGASSVVASWSTSAVNMRAPMPPISSRPRSLAEVERGAGQDGTRRGHPCIHVVVPSASARRRHAASDEGVVVVSHERSFLSAPHGDAEAADSAGTRDRTRPPRDRCSASRSRSRSRRRGRRTCCRNGSLGAAASSGTSKSRMISP